jgi:glycosyltransferase involved in cell wall biosynthesis
MVKNVWILNHYAVPPGTSGGTRHYSLAKSLHTCGWNAYILAASVEHLNGKQRLAAKEKSRLEVCDDVPFLWLNTPRYRGNGGGRMRNMLAYAVRAWNPANTKDLPRPDAVIGSSVHPFAAVSGALLAKRFRVPFVFEVRDLWPQTLIDLGRIKDHSLMARTMRGLERWLYRRADRVVTLLPRAVDYIAPLGVDVNKVVWIPNGVELTSFPDPGAPTDATGRPFVLMYFGSHGQANGLDNVLYAMKQLQEQPAGQPVYLRMIGDGPAKPALQDLARRLDLHNVSYEPPVTKADIPRIAAQADAFVLTVLDKPKLYRYGISMNKLFDYLAGHRPVLMASLASNNPVQDAGAGLTVPPENPEALAAAIRQLVALPLSERVSMGGAGRRYVEHNNDFKILAGKLAATLDECVADQRGDS